MADRSGIICHVSDTTHRGTGPTPAPLSPGEHQDGATPTSTVTGRDRLSPSPTRCGKCLRDLRQFNSSTIQAPRDAGTVACMRARSASRPHKRRRHCPRRHRLELASACWGLGPDEVTLPGPASPTRHRSWRTRKGLVRLRLVLGRFVAADPIGVQSLHAPRVVGEA
jgi:hypothetical protein